MSDIVRFDMVTVVNEIPNKYDIWEYWEYLSPKITDQIRRLEKDKDFFDLHIPNRPVYRSRLCNRAAYWGWEMHCHFDVSSLRTRGGGYRITRFCDTSRGPAPTGVQHLFLGEPINA